MNTSNTAPVIKAKKGWPLRHSRRCYWFHRKLLVTYRILVTEVEGAKTTSGLFDNPTNYFIWSEEEYERLLKIKAELEALYNERFEQYKKMVAKEKGLDYVPSGKVNNFILK